MKLAMLSSNMYFSLLIIYYVLTTFTGKPVFLAKSEEKVASGTTTLGTIAQIVSCLCGVSGVQCSFISGAFEFFVDSNY